ncbi:unnamed protein product [Kuraishia capsulata CBS 1993]|uniref:Transmembrane protein n=1 Tax=Kuraishia capsulata CBS 1993 TaxID=1382522 RepID=W6MMG8_9ASCO|nr:uncharacterized protein KUCA_T00002088001 [Kuraishia capsulata CBS 1993]CDK26117.1 unnamed protein product [Kuraishia capsulata CBS 1993]
MNERYEAASLLPNNAFEVNIQNVHPLDQPILRTRSAPNTRQKPLKDAQLNAPESTVTAETISKGFSDLVGFLQMIAKLVRFVAMRVWRFVVWLDLLNWQETGMVHLPSFAMGLVFVYLLVSLFGGRFSGSGLVTLLVCGAVVALMFTAENSSESPENQEPISRVTEERTATIPRRTNVVRRNSDRPRLVNLAMEPPSTPRRNSAVSRNSEESPKKSARYHFVKNANK